jgi:phosphoadenosine phosphosulfate reductase
MTQQPGLDLHTLAALRRPHPNTANITNRIRNHLDNHDGYLAFSGGKDSLVTLHLALSIEPNVPVAFFDSGLEFPETYRYLEHISNLLNIDLHWIHARRTTLQILADSGTWNHSSPTGIAEKMHDILITEPSARAHSAHGPGELWGVRAQESRGRAALYANALRSEIATQCDPGCSCSKTTTGTRRQHGGIICRIDGTTAYGPIWDWKTPDVWAYIARHQLPINPVYTRLRALGAPEHFLRVSHMLDGNRLEAGRVTWLRRGWPDIFEDLTAVLPRIREFV